MLREDIVGFYGVPFAALVANSLVIFSLLLYNIFPGITRTYGTLTCDKDT